MLSGEGRSRLEKEIRGRLKTVFGKGPEQIEISFFSTAKFKQNDFKGISDLINKKSGVAGISGLSSDMRDLENAAAEGHERAQLALDMYYYRVKQFIGSYAAAMDGVDLIIFTGGIGENDSVLREKVSSSLHFLGVDFDPEANRGVRGKDKMLTKPNSRVKVMAITTNEELVIASDTAQIVNGISK